MKYLFTFSFLLLFLSSYGQDYYTDFVNACQTDDTTKQIQILEQWEKEDPNNPEYFTSRFNYHFMKSRTEVIEIMEDQPDGDSFKMQDESGKTAGYLGSGVYYNPNEIKTAYQYIDEGIRKYPLRLDMRFGKIHTQGQMEDWDGFTEEIIKTVQLSKTKKAPWLWTLNEEREGDNEFLLSVIQDYQLQLYNTQDDRLLIYMRKIANAILDEYPDHVESLSNLSITHSLLGEYDKALQPLIKAEKINPNDYIVTANIANIYKLQGKNEQAIAYYEKLLSVQEPGVSEFAKEQIEILKKK